MHRSPPEYPKTPPPFRATRSLVALDHFRVPYVIDQPRTGSRLHHVRAGHQGPELLWPSDVGVCGRPVAAMLGADDEHGIPVFAPVMPDGDVGRVLAERAGRWEPCVPVTRAGGGRIGSIWRSAGGSLFLPFDPDIAHRNLLSERYHEILGGSARRGMLRLATHSYYRARGAVPKTAQIWMRRRYVRVQARSSFPRWPVETGLHDLLDMLLAALRAIADEPVPTLRSWPEGRRWALVLSHDVEKAAGLEAMDDVLALERGLGLRSCWNFVPQRYDVSPTRIRQLQSDGFEVGVHGLYHDGRDLTNLPRRLPQIRSAAARWGAVGFRSPSMHRRWHLMPSLGFDYDSSYPDTDPFEPQAGGCCSWLPFLHRGMVELPMTMPQDHTLFVILRRPSEHAWLDKATLLRARGGMALLDTHPDYMRDRSILNAYRSFLETFADDPDMWQALPREVSAWWRRRAASQITRSGDEWTVAGPAAGEARIELLAPGGDWMDALQPAPASGPVVGPDWTPRRAQVGPRRRLVPDNSGAID